MYLSLSQKSVEDMTAHGLTIDVDQRHYNLLSEMIHV